MNRWHLRVSQAIGHVVVIVWDQCWMVNRGRGASGAKKERVMARNDVRRPPHYLHVRRTPNTVNFVKIGGNKDVAKRRLVGRVEGIQSEEEPKGRVSNNVRTHKEPLRVSTVVLERRFNNNLDRAKLSAVNDKLCV